MNKPIFISILTFATLFASIAAPATSILASATSAATAETTLAATEKVASEKIRLPDGTMALTLAGVKAMDEKVSAELSELCSSDPECKMQTFYERAENDGDYVALSGFYNDIAFLSAINPSENTLKFYYQGTDSFRRWYDSDEEPFKLEKLAMAWHFNIGAQQSSMNSWWYLREKDEIDLRRVKIFYEGTSSEHGLGWLPPDTENELTSTTADLAELTDGKLQFTFKAGESNATGWFIFNECLDSPYYESGMECRIVFDEFSSARYVPYLNGEPAWPDYLYIEESGDTDDETGSDSETDDNSGNIKTDDNNNSDNSGDDNNSNTNNNSSNSNVSSNNNSETDSEAANSTEKSAISTSPAVNPSNTTLATTAAAVTSSATSNETSSAEVSDESADDLAASYALPLAGGDNCENSVEFPWWFIILVLVCDALLLWLFWPKNRQQNSLKNSKN